MVTQQRELEEKGAAVHQALEDEKKTNAKLQKTVRERDNEKAKAAYLATQSAQEAAQAVHWFEGTREAVEGLRALAMQAQQPAYVPYIDLLSQVANVFDPSHYQEEQDPVLQQVDISEDSSDKTSSSPTHESSGESSGGEMEGVVEGRTSKKRGWEERWEVAEDRDGYGGNERAHERGNEQEKNTKRGEAVVEEGMRKLRRDTALLARTVEANQQIEEQEVLQRQQDKEAAVLHAKMELEARIQGQQTIAVAPTQLSLPPPNPRLDLDKARRREDTPSGSETSNQGGRHMEHDGPRKAGRRRRRKSASRTPRGRTHGQDTMD